MPVQAPPKEEVASSRSDDTKMESQPHGSAAKTIFDAIPLTLVLRLAAPYLAGQSAEDAIRQARKVYSENRFAGTLDILGEDATVDEQCDASVKNYMSLIDTIQANPLPVKNPRERLTVSFKPSMFSTEAPNGGGSRKALDKAFDRINKIVEYAQQHGTNVTLEAEDHRWANFHLETYFALIDSGYTNVGTVLQTRLFRTEKDIARFDDRMRVRLVIGIYNEPKEIAHTNKDAMKDLVVDYARELLKRGTYVELATHDVNCIDNFYKKVAVPNRIPSSQYEHQFLLGVPRQKLQKGLVSGTYFEELASKQETIAPNEAAFVESLAQSGAVVRVYLPFGTAAVSGAYCRRRLRENPNMIGYGIKNLLRIQ